MAKRGRRSIRNKRKSVKKYSSKRRSKTMRYLRGGQITEGEVRQQVVSENDEHLIRKRTMREDDFDLCMKRCKANSTNYKNEVDLDGFYECIKKCSISANPIDDDDDYDSDGGGRRRYYKRKQSKSRSKSRKH